MEEEFNSQLPTPPLDPLFFNQNSDQNDNLNVPDLSSDFEDMSDFDITFDDLTDLYFPSENEQFLIPDNNAVSPDMGRSDNLGFESGSLEGCLGVFDSNPVNLESPESGGSGICGDQGGLEVDKYLNPSPSEAGSCDSGGSDSRSSDLGPASSHGSGNSGSGVLNAGSPESGTNGNPCNYVVDQKVVKTETESARNLKNDKIALTKRKKEMGDGENGDVMRNFKSRKAEGEDVSVNVSGGVVSSEEEEKRKARLVRNRESAHLSRQRKKHYVEELEDKVRAMHSTIADLNGKVSYFMAENATLRQQLNGNSACPPPMYAPMAPYPWVPCAPYVVKPQGSQVPLVPIPRLKPQQAVPMAKTKKVESKKGEGKTKKVASVSLVGLIFFILLFGGLVPMVDVKFGGVRESGISGFGFGSERFLDQHKGRVLIVDGHSNGSHENVGVGLSNEKIHCLRGRTGCPEHDSANKGAAEHVPGSDEFGQFGNASEQLVASLYVPRNDKLVKIDGNLIIHSILASERAMASHESPEVNITKQTALAIPDVGNNRGRHSHVYRTHAERQKALASGSADTSKDNVKSSAAKGKLQQWFREGLAGPLLSSGMCTEVFQFDVSPTPGAIVPASSVANVTAEHQKNNSTRLNKGRNRRILRGLPIPLAGSDLNITGEHAGRNTHKESFQGNKSVSPMVVSVLVDPREAGDSDVDGVITPKSLSRIFVVVLVDSIKYVTYSCVLPSIGPHLVTT
ncbi:bZIP transcription factor 17-like [Populus nigra]|uniref:bZIP transcription factor 17-like n=1 Tax=Populus nigra TaxID=3691 RepID=UPI002B26B279|nr:bZIP transcription factor 17-like [Populus nigra]